MASGTEARSAAPTPRRGRDPEGRMSLGEHFKELRNRLIICAVAVVVLAVVGWIVYPVVFEFLKRPFEMFAGEAEINFQGVATGLNVRLQLSAYTGLILASPVIILQIWLFVMPGLHRNERRYALGFFGSAIPLFFLGCVAGYWAVNQLVPVLLSFTPTADEVVQYIQYDEYLSLLVKTMIAFGVAFVMPVVLVLLNFMGLVRGKSMLKAWRWVVFLCFAFTAVMVPTPEPLTLIGMSAAISSLFFAAVGISIMHDRRVGAKEAAAEDELPDDVASSLDDAVEPIDAPDTKDESGRS